MYDHLTPLRRDPITVGVPHQKYHSIITRYETLGDLIDYVQRHPLDNATLRKVSQTKSAEGIYFPPPTMMWANQYTPNMLREENGKPKINCVATPEAALDLALRGWPEGREYVARRQAEVSALLRERIQAPTFYHDQVGHEVDVPAYLSGVPEHMLSFEVQDSVWHKHLHLVVDITTRCDACSDRYHDAAPTPPEWSMARGATVALLLDLLHRLGWRLTVDVCTVSFIGVGTRKYARVPQVWRQDRRGEWRVVDTPDDDPRPIRIKRTVIVNVLKPGDAFDLDRVCFMLAHDGFGRYLLSTEAILRGFDHWGGFHDDIARIQTSRGWGGKLTVGSAHWDPNLPEVGEVDVFLPSLPAMNDAAGAPHQAGTAMGQVLQDVEGYDFESIVGGIQWILAQLEALGVVVQ